MSREEVNLLAAIGLGALLTLAFIVWFYVATGLFALAFRENEALVLKFEGASQMMLVFYVVALAVWSGGGLYLGVKYIPGLFGI